MYTLFACRINLLFKPDHWRFAYYGSSPAYSVVASVALSDFHIEGKLEECELLLNLCHRFHCQYQQGIFLYEQSFPDRDCETFSGNVTSRYFCGGCGSPIHTVGPSRPGKTVVKMGLFAGEASSLDSPAAEIFTVNREKWETVRRMLLSKESYTISYSHTTLLHFSQFREQSNIIAWWTKGDQYDPYL